VLPDKQEISYLPMARCVMPSQAHEVKLTHAASTDTPGTGQKKQRKGVLSVDP
jgi:hypothetical protein